MAFLLPLIALSGLVADSRIALSVHQQSSPSLQLLHQQSSPSLQLLTAHLRVIRMSDAEKGEAEPKLRAPPKVRPEDLTESQRRRLKPVSDLKRKSQYDRPAPEDERGWGDRRPGSAQ